jgi:hypothetical protein
MSQPQEMLDHSVGTDPIILHDFAYGWDSYKYCIIHMRNHVILLDHSEILQVTMYKSPNHT